jgi:hypothetical protein
MMKSFKRYLKTTIKNDLGKMINEYDASIDKKIKEKYPKGYSLMMNVFNTSDFERLEDIITDWITGALEDEKEIEELFSDLEQMAKKI